MTPLEKVTWLQPVKNAAPFLRETLESLVHQTYPEAEVLAWDNGSTDSTVTILQEYVPRLLPGRIITDRPQETLGASLALMVEEAETAWLARIDGDDVCKPERLSKQMALLNKHPDWVGCGSQATTIDPLGVQGWSYKKSLDPAESRWAMFYTNPFVHPTMVFKRSAALEAGNYKPMPMGQDYDFWYRLTNVGKIGNHPESLLLYRIHPQSISSQNRRDWKPLHRQLIQQYHDLLFPGISLPDIERVWEQLSSLGSKPGLSVELGDTLLAMAEAASLHPVWSDTRFRSLKLFREDYHRITPQTPHTMAVRAKLWMESFPGFTS